MKSFRWPAFLYGGVVLLGCLQIAGYVTGNQSLRGLGVALVCAPLPIVFTEVKGVETFTSAFTLKYKTVEGEAKKIPVTPALYGQFKAPYNLRNVYGAAMAYGPILPEALTQSVLNAGFCGDGKLRKSLGIRAPIDTLDVFIQTKTRGRNDSWTLKLACQR